MGEYADAIIDQMIFGSAPRLRRRHGFQSGVGNYMWRDSAGRVLDMHDMSEGHLRNAIAVCERKGNSGKAAQLNEVLLIRKPTHALHADDGYLPEYGGN